MAAACFFHLRWTLVVDEEEDGDELMMVCEYGGLMMSGGWQW